MKVRINGHLLEELQDSEQQHFEMVSAGKTAISLVAFTTAAIHLGFTIYNLFPPQAVVAFKLQ